MSHLLECNYRLRQEISTVVTGNVERKYVHQHIESNLILLELRITQLEKEQAACDPKTDPEKMEAIVCLISDCRTKLEALIELYGSIRNIKPSNS
jgi:hypothetical protein